MSWKKKVRGQVARCTQDPGGVWGGGWSMGQIEGLGQRLGSGLGAGHCGSALHRCLVPELVIFIGCSNCTLRKNYCAMKYFPLPLQSVSASFKIQ